MSKLGSTFTESYINFFKFFSDSSKSISEIDTFISLHRLKNYSNLNQINLNMIDTKNLNILFHVIRKSKSDEECLEKMKFLIEKYDINYNLFDINRRTLPFYTCVKGYLNSTKYLLDKMDYNIAIKDNKEETLFFSAIRSYNIELVKYLDNKFKGWIFYPNKEYSSCIFNIFKKSMKDEGEKKIKNLLNFILERGFNIDEKNKNNVSFRDLCVSYKIDNCLNEIIKEKNRYKPKINYENSEINNENKINESTNKSLKNETNINHNKKEEKKSKSVNSNFPSKNIKNNLNNFNASNMIIKNGINKNNKKNEIINKTPKKKKKICCIFQHIKNDQLIINKIYEKLATNEYMKEKYLNKINDSLNIPSFEKGSINIIRNSIEKEK